MEDKRDLRDPQQIGQAMFDFRHLDHATSHPLPFHEIADLPRVQSAAGPSDSTYSTVKFTTHAYMTKMQQQAANGDVAALRTLLDKGWPLPLDADVRLIERARQMGSAKDEVVE